MSDYLTRFADRAIERAPVLAPLELRFSRSKLRLDPMSSAPQALPEVPSIYRARGVDLFAWHTTRATAPDEENNGAARGLYNRNSLLPEPGDTEPAAQATQTLAGDAYADTEAHEANTENSAPVAVEAPADASEQPSPTTDRAQEMPVFRQLLATMVAGPGIDAPDRASRFAGDLHSPGPVGPRITAGDAYADTEAHEANTENSAPVAVEAPADASEQPSSTTDRAQAMPVFRQLLATMVAGPGIDAPDRASRFAGDLHSPGPVGPRITAGDAYADTEAHEANTENSAPVAVEAPADASEQPSSTTDRAQEMPVFRQLLATMVAGPGIDAPARASGFAGDLRSPDPVGPRITAVEPSEPMVAAADENDAQPPIALAHTSIHTPAPASTDALDSADVAVSDYHDGALAEMLAPASSSMDDNAASKRLSPTLSAPAMVAPGHLVSRRAQSSQQSVYATTAAPPSLPHGNADNAETAAYEATTRAAAHEAAEVATHEATAKATVEAHGNGERSNTKVNATSHAQPAMTPRVLIPAGKPPSASESALSTPSQGTTQSEPGSVTAPSGNAGIDTGSVDSGPRHGAESVSPVPQDGVLQHETHDVQGAHVDTSMASRAALPRTESPGTQLPGIQPIARRLDGPMSERKERAALAVGDQDGSSPLKRAISQFADSTSRATEPGHRAAGAPRTGAMEPARDTARNHDPSGLPDASRAAQPTQRIHPSTQVTETTVEDMPHESPTRRETVSRQATTPVIQRIQAEPSTATASRSHARNAHTFAPRVTSTQKSMTTDQTALAPHQTTQPAASSTSSSHTDEEGSISTLMQLSSRAHQAVQQRSIALRNHTMGAQATSVQVARAPGAAFSRTHAPSAPIARASRQQRNTTVSPPPKADKQKSVFSSPGAPAAPAAVHPAHKNSAPNHPAARSNPALNNQALNPASKPSPELVQQALEAFSKGPTERAAASRVLSTLSAMSWGRRAQSTSQTSDSAPKSDMRMTATSDRHTLARTAQTPAQTASPAIQPNSHQQHNTAVSTLPKADKSVPTSSGAPAAPAASHSALNPVPNNQTSKPSPELVQQALEAFSKGPAERAAASRMLSTLSAMSWGRRAQSTSQTSDSAPKSDTRMTATSDRHTLARTAQTPAQTASPAIQPILRAQELASTSSQSALPAQRAGAAQPSPTSALTSQPAHARTRPANASLSALRPTLSPRPADRISAHGSRHEPVDRDASPSVSVSIGQITVQAAQPSQPPPPAPARPKSPILSLSDYLRMREEPRT